MKRMQEAFTLAELLMAMSIIAVIGLSVAGLTMTLSAAHASGLDYYSNVHTGRSAMMRIIKELNKAKLITAAGPHVVVYWADDVNADGAINLAELKAVNYESDSKRLETFQVVFPDDMDAQVRQALDERVPLATANDLSSVISLIATNPRFLAGELAGNIWAFDVCVYPNCPMTRLVTIRIKVGDQKESITLRSAAAMRASWVDQVGISNYQYVLMTDSAAP